MSVYEEKMTDVVGFVKAWEAETEYFRSIIASKEAEIARLRATLEAQLEAHNYAEVLEIARKALTLDMT